MKKEIKINEVGQVMLTTDNGMLDYDGNPKVVVNTDDKFECNGEIALMLYSLSHNKCFVHRVIDNKYYRENEYYYLNNDELSKKLEELIEKVNVYKKFNRKLIEEKIESLDEKNKLISENGELKSIKYEWEHIPKWIIKLFI